MIAYLALKVRSPNPLKRAVKHLREGVGEIVAEEGYQAQRTHLGAAGSTASRLTPMNSPQSRQ